MSNTSNNETTKNKEVELIVARLEVLPAKVYFSSGEGGSSISRDDMIKHVKARDSIGEEFIKTELEFLRALKNGKLLKQILSPQIAAEI